jgi:twitching motility protein PilT
MIIFELLAEMVNMKASDLHLRVGSPPMFRVMGKLKPRPETPPMSIEESESIFDALTNPIGRKAFENELELDCAYSLPGVGRFRVNILKQRSTLAFAIRMVPFVVPTIDSMQIPAICKELILRPRGLILVTGPTGSGKSTTMAAMIDHLNDTESRNIITVEDPIEYLHHNKKSIIAWH